MFVRAFDTHTKEYYKSMVYALVNSGIFEQAVLYHPVLDSFVLQPHLCRGENQEFRPLYECIQPGQADWHPGSPQVMAALHTAPTGEAGARPVSRLLGYPEVVGDPYFLQTLLSTGFVPFENTVIRRREPADCQVWTYIRVQADADLLMEQFAGFHDATLDRLFYKECNGTRQLTARFDNSSWYGTIDLCFEGMRSLHLEPAGENFSREILEACLLVREETIFWADAALQEEDLSGSHNHIKALNLKWRTVRRRHGRQR